MVSGATCIEEVHPLHGDDTYDVLLLICTCKILYYMSPAVVKSEDLWQLHCILTLSIEGLHKMKTVHETLFSLYSRRKSTSHATNLVCKGSKTTHITIGYQ